MNRIAIASRRELFVDCHLLGSFEGQARLKLHPPKREEVVFQAGGPLENACSGVYSALVASEGRYLLYYRGFYPIKDADASSNRQ